MKFLNAVCAFILMATGAWADAPVAIINIGVDGSADSGTSFVPGDLIVATAGPVAAKLDDPDPIMKWFIEPERYPDGRSTWLDVGSGKVVVGSRPGRYRLELIVATPEGIARAVREIVVAGASPGPVVNPDPYGFVAIVNANATQIPAASKAIAPRIAANYRAGSLMARAGAAGGIPGLTFDAINLAIKTANQTLPPADKAAWDPVMRPLMERLTQITGTAASATALNTAADALEGIAEAVETVK